MYSSKPSDKPFPQDYSGDGSYNQLEGASWGKNLSDIFSGAGAGIGSVFRGAGAGVGGAVSGVATGATDIIKSPFEAVGGILGTLKWPLMILGVVVILAVLYSVLKPSPEEKMMEMQMRMQQMRTMQQPQAYQPY